MRILLRFSHPVTWDAANARAMSPRTLVETHDMEPYQPKPLLTSKADGRRMLGNIGSTKFDEMIASGQIESVKIGSRRLVKVASLMRVANVGTDQKGEVS